MISIALKAVEAFVKCDRFICPQRIPECAMSAQCVPPSKRKVSPTLLVYLRMNSPDKWCVPSSGIARMFPKNRKTRFLKMCGFRILRRPSLSATMSAKHWSPQSFEIYLSPRKKGPKSADAVRMLEEVTEAKKFVFVRSSPTLKLRNSFLDISERPNSILSVSYCICAAW